MMKKVKQLFLFLQKPVDFFRGKNKFNFSSSQSVECLNDKLNEKEIKINSILE
jgi:hypothetical protein